MEIKNIFKVFFLIRILVLGNECSTVYTDSPTLPKESCTEELCAKKLSGTGISDHFIFIDENRIMRDEEYNEIKRCKDNERKHNEPYFEGKIDDILDKFNSLKHENPDLVLT